MNPKTKEIALVAGGYSGEHEVSLRSQKGIAAFLEGSPYHLHLVVVERDNWWVTQSDGTRIAMDKNDFTYRDECGNRISFDYAYITIHGTPGEDGLLPGYLEMLGIPHSTVPSHIGALTFNKYICNRYLSTFGIAIPKNQIVRKGVPFSEECLVSNLGLPLFVKPNSGGSSLATYRIDQPDELFPAIKAALEVCDEVILESLITGTEVTCGAYSAKEGEVHLLPITEVVPKRLFFDYDAKYKGAVEEITPARIPQAQSEEIYRLTEEIYRTLGARGIIRVDYIIKDGKPYLLEVNTTPGMTETSFIPQQIAADGQEVGDVLSSIIEYHLS